MKLNLGFRLVSFKQAELWFLPWKRAVEWLLGLCGFMARSLLKVLREGRLWVLGHAGLIFARCKSMGWHCCSYREGSLNPDFISFADSTRHSDFSGCLSKCLCSSRQVGFTVNGCCFPASEISELQAANCPKRYSFHPDRLSLQEV